MTTIQTYLSAPFHIIGMYVFDRLLLKMLLLFAVEELQMRFDSGLNGFRVLFYTSLKQNWFIVFKSVFDGRVELWYCVVERKKSLQNGFVEHFCCPCYENTYKKDFTFQIWNINDTGVIPRGIHKANLCKNSWRIVGNYLVKFLRFLKEYLKILGGVPSTSVMQIHFLDNGELVLIFGTGREATKSMGLRSDFWLLFIPSVYFEFWISKDFQRNLLFATELLLLVPFVEYNWTPVLSS